MEQWARDQKIEDTETKVIDTLLPIIQVNTTHIFNQFLNSISKIMTVSRVKKYLKSLKYLSFERRLAFYNLKYYTTFCFVTGMLEILFKFSIQFLTKNI